VTARAPALATLLLSLLLAPAAFAKGKPYVTRWYPFELRGGHIFVPVKVGGIDTHALLDTGASVHMLDRSFALQHGIGFSFATAIEVQAGHSRERLPVARNVPIELFGARVKLSFAPVSEIAFADLVIGTSVLSSFVMQIDYANARIRFTSHDAVKLKEHANVELRRSSASDLPALRANVDGEDVWLMLDTGLTGPLILTPRFADPRGWPEDTGTIGFDAFGTAKAMTRYRVPLIQIGPYDLRGVVAAVPADGRLPRLLTASEAGRVRLSGVLGAEILKHFLVTLDLKHMRAHLQHSPKLEGESWESSVSSDDAPPELDGEVGAADAEATAP
jgi:predicted aspartyl protease